jgi:hypothetical protein
MSRRTATPSLPTRLTASATALLVLALTVFAASPVLHAWLHGHPADSHPVKRSAATADHAGCTHADHAPASAPHGDDELCVVTQFAHGNADCAPAPLLAQVAILRVVATVSLSAAPAPRAPALFLPPGCGPPAV